MGSCKRSRLLEHRNYIPEQKLRQTKGRRFEPWFRHFQLLRLFHTTDTESCHVDAFQPVSLPRLLGLEKCTNVVVEEKGRRKVLERDALEQKALHCCSEPLFQPRLSLWNCLKTSIHQTIHLEEKLGASLLFCRAHTPGLTFHIFLGWMNHDRIMTCHVSVSALALQGVWSYGISGECWYPAWQSPQPWPNC